jgi:excinuclease ABC subunit C
MKIITSHLPHHPGVYFFKDSFGKIIYIGKAKNLQRRVSSYFLKNQDNYKTKLLVDNIVSVDFTVFNNEIEALLFENKSIKQYKPKYNINLKDGKTYAYIALSKDSFPRIYSTRIISDKHNLFGPYTDGSSRHELIKLAVKLFKLRTCKNLPKRACLNYHINLCSGPCINKISSTNYKKDVNRVNNFLKNDHVLLLKELKQDMFDASKEQKYELALEKKKQIKAIEHLSQKQRVDLVKNFDQDVIGMVNNDKKVTITVFSIIKGVISGKKDFSFNYYKELMADFLKMYYSNNYIPNEIIISSNVDDQDLIQKYLSHLKKSNVVITIPQKGEKKKLLELAEINARSSLDNVILKKIQNEFNLPSLPMTIECFDISNLSGNHVVGAMTQWVAGKPNKPGYRKFEIKSFTGQDDFAAMAEVVNRRYKRLKEEEKSMPDLIIIDGGLGQLNAAINVLKSIDLQIPIISLAKRDEEIYLPFEDFPRKYLINSPMMLLIRQIRDSVHNFVLSYNIKKREMAFRKE